MIIAIHHLTNTRKLLLNLWTFCSLQKPAVNSSNCHLRPLFVRQIFFHIFGLNFSTAERLGPSASKKSEQENLQQQNKWANSTRKKFEWKLCVLCVCLFVIFAVIWLIEFPFVCFCGSPDSPNSFVSGRMKLTWNNFFSFYGNFCLRRKWVICMLFERERDSGARFSWWTFFWHGLNEIA